MISLVEQCVCLCVCVCVCDWKSAHPGLELAQRPFHICQPWCALITAAPSAPARSVQDDVAPQASLHTHGAFSPYSSSSSSSSRSRKSSNSSWTRPHSFTSSLLYSLPLLLNYLAPPTGSLTALPLLLLLLLLLSSVLCGQRERLPAGSGLRVSGRR